jgi:hypothetical protein
MLGFLAAYLLIPRRWRFVLRWLAAGFFIVVLALVVIFFARVILTLPGDRYLWFHPKSHQPLSPDFIKHHPKHAVLSRSTHEG